MKAIERIKKAKIKIMKSNPFFSYLALYLKEKEVDKGKILLRTADEMANTIRSYTVVEVDGNEILDFVESVRIFDGTRGIAIRGTGYERTPKRFRGIKWGVENAVQSGGVLSDLDWYGLIIDADSGQT